MRVNIGEWHSRFCLPADRWMNLVSSERKISESVISIAVLDDHAYDAQQTTDGDRKERILVG